MSKEDHWSTSIIIIDHGTGSSLASHEKFSREKEEESVHFTRVKIGVIYTKSAEIGDLAEIVTIFTLVKCAFFVF